MEEFRHLHFIGVGGIGMSAIAQLCRHAGMRVTGSDRGAERSENRRIIDALRAQGIEIFPQDGSFTAAGMPDALVYSTAIEEDNPDFRAAEGARRLHRSDALVYAVRRYAAPPSIAVSGSCGKTSVTAYLAEALVRLGMDAAALNGGLMNAFRSRELAGNFRPGRAGMVFEADESDKSLLAYEPDYALILNIGTDHYDREELARMFGRFAARTKKGLVVSAAVAEALGDGLARTAPVRIFDRGGVEGYEVADGAAYAVVAGARLRLPQPGMHTALNLMAVAEMLALLGFAEPEIAAALGDLSGVWRRFDYAGTGRSGARFYDDYAHNPEKIACVIRAARELAGPGGGRVTAIFQPHGYKPFGFMRDELYSQAAAALGERDNFVLLEPYYAGGTSSGTPHAEEVAADWRARGGIPHLYSAFDRRAAQEILANECRPTAGDVVLVLGARDNSLSDWARELSLFL